MAHQNYIPDDQLDAEIERLTNSEAVKLARLEQRIAYKKRQYLYQLRWYEKRGLNLMENGVTMDSLKIKESIYENEEEKK